MIIGRTLATYNGRPLGFARRGDFDLSAYAAQSFGVFQEAPINVVLRFEPEAAADATAWLLHPSRRASRARQYGRLSRNVARP